MFMKHTYKTFVWLCRCQKSQWFQLTFFPGYNFLIKCLLLLKYWKKLIVCGTKIEKIVQLAHQRRN